MEEAAPITIEGETVEKQKLHELEQKVKELLDACNELLQKNEAYAVQVEAACNRLRQDVAKAVSERSHPIHALRGIIRNVKVVSHVPEAMRHHTPLDYLLQEERMIVDATDTVAAHVTDHIGTIRKIIDETKSEIADNTHADPELDGNLYEIMISEVRHLDSSKSIDKIQQIIVFIEHQLHLIMDMVKKLCVQSIYIHTYMNQQGNDIKAKVEQRVREKGHPAKIFITRVNDVAALGDYGDELNRISRMRTSILRQLTMLQSLLIKQ